MVRERAHGLPVVRARRLRREATVPERFLWSRLRAGRLGEIKFRRQHPIGPYVADFFCAERSLLIELEGRSHDGHERYDEQRTAYFATLGLRVIRFSNDHVLRDLDEVVKIVACECGLDA